MAPSTVIDIETGEAYSDILTADYASFDFTRPPKRIRLEPQHLEKPFYLSHEHYGTFHGDDILLDINLVPHYTFLSSDRPFFIPTAGDFSAFVKRQTSQAKTAGKL